MHSINKKDDSLTPSGFFETGLQLLFQDAFLPLGVCYVNRFNASIPLVDMPAGNCAMYWARFL